MPPTPRRLRVVPAAVCSGAALLATWGFASGAGAASTPKATTAASSLLSTALANAQKATAVHINVQSSEATEHLSVSGNDGSQSGTEAMSLKQGSKSESVAGRYVGGAVYFKANNAGLKSYLGVKTSDLAKYANHWLSLSSSDPEFTDAAGSMTVATTLREVSVSNPTLAKGTKTVDGVKVKVLHGTPAAGTSTTDSTATLYVTASGAPLPISYSESGETQGHKASGQITFSHWNKHFTVAAPKGATTAANVIGSASSSTGSGS